MKLYLEMGPLKGDEGEMRSQRVGLIQCDLVTSADQDHCTEDNHVQTQGGDGIHTKERSLRRTSLLVSGLRNKCLSPQPVSSS